MAVTVIPVATVSIANAKADVAYVVMVKLSVGFVEIGFLTKFTVNEIFPLENSVSKPFNTSSCYPTTLHVAEADSPALIAWQIPFYTDGVI